MTIKELRTLAEWHRTCGLLRREKLAEENTPREQRRLRDLASFHEASAKQLTGLAEAFSTLGALTAPEA